MAEEEKDDWLEDQDDDESPSQIDQSESDSLLTDDDFDQSDIDSLLANGESFDTPDADQTDEIFDPEELDQSDIDSLLAGEEKDSSAVEDADGIDDSGGATDDIDQSDIDSILAEGVQENSAEEDSGTDDNDGGSDEIGQSDIDSLLAGGERDDSVNEPLKTTAEKDGDDEEIDQSDLDALLSGEPPPTGEEIPDISPDQEEIDRLFSEIDDEPEEEDPFQAEEINFQDVLEEGDEEESFLSPGNEFADEEFELDEDLLDIPDIPVDEEETTVFETQEEAPTPAEEDEIAPETTGAASVASKFLDTNLTMPEVPIPPVLQERKNQAIAGGILGLLLLTLFFFFSGDDDDSSQIAEKPQAEQQQIITPQPEPQPVLQPPAPQNLLPTVTDAEFQLGADGPLAIQLTAHDPEGEKLQYEIMTGPGHGQLKGLAPYLIYIPNKDFPGLDLFNFRVTDGQGFSAPALVKITEKPETDMPKETVQAPASEPQKPEIIKPRTLLISAKNFSYNVVGTKDFLIDWEKVWDEANFLPYTKQVDVEILSKNLHGKLSKKSSTMHLYKAKKYSSGKDEIQYRFKLGKRQSKIRKITLTIDAGNPSPEIVLHPIAEHYKPGEKVLLDASTSMDEKRESLQFSWEQIAGVPVQLDVLNTEGSRVAFIAPSFFSTVKDPGPMMRLTVTDASGKKDVKDIKIPTRSRYSSALWGRVASGMY